jgi:hypothetical protein
MLKNIKIGTKLIGGFTVVALIAVVIGITGILCLRSLAGANVDLYEKATVPEGQLIGMTASLQGLGLLCGTSLSVRTSRSMPPRSMNSKRSCAIGGV